MPLPRGFGSLLTISALGIIALQAHAQVATGSQVVDLRKIEAPPLRLSALGSCPLTYGDPAALPEGLVSCAGAVRLGSGNVAVMDGVARKLFIFDSAGRLLARAGRAGQGPGEFTGTPTLFPYRGDSMLVYNRSLGYQATFLVFSASGRYARTVTVEVDRNAAKRPSVVGASTRDGTISFAGFASAPTVQGKATGLDSVRVFSFNPVGNPVGSTGFAPDAMWARSMTSTPLPATSGRSGGSRVSMSLVSAGGASRARGGFSLMAATLTVNGGPLYHFEEPNDALVVHASDGRVLRRILLPPLAQALRPAPNRIVSQTDAQMLQLLSDDRGRAWLELARENNAAPRRWWIIDQAGALVAEVATPASEQLLFAGADYVLLLRKDANDVQTVVQCRLVVHP